MVLASGESFRSSGFHWFCSFPESAEISFPALRQAISRGKMTFGFSRILTQTLTHTGIRVHGTSGTNRASERGFPELEGAEISGNVSPPHTNRSS